MKHSNAGAGLGKPKKARPATLHRSMSARDAFHAVMLAGIEHLQANEQGLLAGGGPGHLHQVRVALRRLRSAAEIFDPLFPVSVFARLQPGFKWLGARLGPARDWDVFAMESLPAFGRERRASSEVAELTARCERLRSRARARALRAVRSLRYRRFKHSLAALIEARDRPPRLDDTAARAVLLGPVDEFASAVLERRHGQVRKKGHGLGGLSSRELHRLRIAVKKFRYAADFFASLYEARPTRVALKQLARLQDILGAINDAATAANLMAHDEAGRGLHGWSRDRAVTLRRELKVAWKAYGSVKKFW